jgi:acetoin:2,6-dichlorophenolindophenol oxidoreductase subunit alpha
VVDRSGGHGSLREGADVELRVYRTMVTIRSFEQKLQELSKKGILRGSIHFCIGQEAVAAGVCAALKPT